MDVFLLPGFWLDGSSWDEVLPTLERPGRTVHAVTLPGLEARGADRRGIGLADHVRAVVALVDGADSSVVLVGHSGGGAVAQAVADARPDAVARVVYVDALPMNDGQCVNDDLPVVGDEIPLPEWGVFDDADLIDLDDARRASFRQRAIPQPAAVARDPQVLRDPRRHHVPVTVIACEFSGAQVRAAMAAGEPWTAELASTVNLDIVDLPTGHWPQFTRPTDLARVLDDVLGAD